MTGNSIRARGLAYADESKAATSLLAYQSHPRESVDNIADESSALRQQEKDVVADNQQDVTDGTDLTSGTNTGKAPVPDKTTSAPVMQHNELKSAFAERLITVNEIGMPAVSYDEKYWFTPSMSLFEVLSNMEEILSGNEELRWISPHYFLL
ncbi:BgtAc-31510 [Blumeria graminis f. sp. tritici]|uniref:BgtAc-31510 n=2 Tax=Blumeria graminis f. sp. tritici TaxID=62690 RepID=A0A9X9L6V0_BLUGR|nr:hypothetical protein BGT96224_Ac31510 [Blumeria graminis f. sp. tritici 96224]VCU38791.1 BgtAc-31510 [Blumeria graminis f. sp. tritici]